MNKLYDLLDRLEYYRELLEAEASHSRQKELVTVIMITKDDIIREQGRLMRLDAKYRRAS